ncbi:MAG: hypothetical protein ACE14L_07830 [Terriglobales bacterium]
MSELQKKIEQANQQQEHMEAVLRQRVNTSLTPEAQRVLDMRYEPQIGGLVIGCLPVPCWLQLALDGSVWAFGCPWWRTLIPEDHLFEARVLTEVGKVKMHIDGMLEKLDPSKVN